MARSREFYSHFLENVKFLPYALPPPPPLAGLTLIGTLVIVTGLSGVQCRE